MSELLELQHMLQDTSATVAQLERALAANPGSEATQLNLRSVLSRLTQLQSEFDGVADRNALDVCRYRMFVDDSTAPSLRGLSGALGGFQEAFTALYDALKNGRRVRTQHTADVMEATKFGFGYAYPGSVGVVLTLGKERLLFDGGLLDDVVTTFFSLAKAPTRTDIAEIGRRLGPAPLRAIYRWAKAHAGDQLGAEISWRQGHEIKAELLMQRAEMARLRDEIAATSEEVYDPIVKVIGTLTGASTESKRFDFRPDLGEVISGTFKDAISETQTVNLPARYVAHLERVTKVQYSSEQESVSWRLHLLEEGQE